MTNRKAADRSAKETNWMKRLYEINERDLTPGSKFMQSLKQKPGPKKPRKRGSSKQGAAGVYLSKPVSSEGEQG